MRALACAVLTVAALAPRAAALETFEIIGTENGCGAMRSLDVAPDSSVVSVAAARAIDGSSAAWLVERRPDGTFGRQATFAMTSLQLRGARLLADGGVALCGVAVPSGAPNWDQARVLLRLDATWSIAWQRTRNVDASSEHCGRVLPLDDGGFLLPGGDYGAGDALLTRFAADGSVAWSKRIDLGANRFELTHAVPKTTGWWAFGLDGDSFDGDQHVVVLDVDDAGTVSGARVFGEAFPGQQQPASTVVAAGDGGAFLGGAMRPDATTLSSPFVARMAADGGFAWRTALLTRSRTTSDGHVSAIVPLPDGGCAALVSHRHDVTTDCQADPLVARLRADGSVAWMGLFARGTSDGTNDDVGAALVDGAPTFSGFGEDGVDPGGARRTNGWLLSVLPDGTAPTACPAWKRVVFPTRDIPIVTTALVATVTDDVALDTPLVVTAPAVAARRLPGCTGECSPPGVLALPLEVSPPAAAQPLVFVDHATLRWEALAPSGSDAFDLYRGRLSDLPAAGDCFQPGLAVPTATDPELPGMVDAFFYLVAGRNAVGPGPLGNRSDGAPRLAALPCP